MIRRIRKIFKKTAPHYGYKDTAQANRDWLVILAVFIIIALGVIVINARLFIRIDKGELFVTPNTASTIVSNTIDETLLDDTLKFFEEKRNRFEELKRTTPPIPSVR